MADSSFDIVSKLDQQEIDNAINQTQREVSQRFDFKNTGATIERSGEHAVEISANADDRATAVLDVFKDKLIKRNQSLKIVDAGDPRQSGKESKISVTLKEGITTEDAKKVGKLIRDEGPKGVKVQVQGDELRVSSKKRDDLQSVIALVKEQDYEFAGAVHELPLTPGYDGRRLAAREGGPPHPATPAWPARPRGSPLRQAVRRPQTGRRRAWEGESACGSGDTW